MIIRVTITTKIKNPVDEDKSPHFSLYPNYINIYTF